MNDWNWIHFRGLVHVRPTIRISIQTEKILIKMPCNRVYCVLQIWHTPKSHRPTISFREPMHPSNFYMQPTHIIRPIGIVRQKSEKCLNSNPVCTVFTSESSCGYGFVHFPSAMFIPAKCCTCLSAAIVAHRVIPFWLTLAEIQFGLPFVVFCKHYLIWGENLHRITADGMSMLKLKV